MSSTKQSNLMDEFMYACQLGVTQKAIEINKSHPKLVSQIPEIEKFYVTLLENGHEDTALWLVTIHPGIFDLIFDNNTSKFINKFLMLVCKKNYIRTAKLIMYEHTVDFRIHERYFFNACIFNAIDMAKFIYSCSFDHSETLSETEQLCKYALSSFELTITDFEDLFITCCSMASDKTAKWLYESFPKIKAECSTERLITACGDGAKELAQWIYERRSPTDSIDFESLVLDLCIKNALDVAEWALEMATEMTVRWKNLIFVQVCFYGTIEAAKWVYEKMPEIDVTANENHVFKTACHRGNEELVRWLLSLGIQITEDSEMDIIFEMLCYEEEVAIARLLAEHSTRYYLTVTEEEFAGGFFYIEDWWIKKSIKPIGLSFDTEEDECCVCFETSNTVTDCNHHVCTNCITKINNSCPYCRNEIAGYYIC